MTYTDYLVLYSRKNNTEVFINLNQIKSFSKKKVIKDGYQYDVIRLLLVDHDLMDYTVNSSLVNIDDEDNFAFDRLCVDFRTKLCFELEPHLKVIGDKDIELEEKVKHE